MGDLTEKSTHSLYTPIFTHYTHAARSRTRRTRLWSSGEVNNTAFVLLSYVMCVCFYVCVFDLIIKRSWKTNMWVDVHRVYDILYRVVVWIMWDRSILDNNIWGNEIFCSIFRSFTKKKKIKITEMSQKKNTKQFVSSTVSIL